MRCQLSKDYQNINSKVSCHYFIKKNGTVINLVPDLYISWHAGVSHLEKPKKNKQILNWNRDT